MKAPDLPEVTAEHRLAAFEKMCWRGWSFESALQDSTRRALIEARAHQIRTREWAATQQRSVIPVKRVRLGVDGHPLWCTQMAAGEFKPDLFPTP